MNRILNYTISDADAGMIVLDFLRKQGFSRHILTAMKADKEALSVNDQKVGGRTILCAGDHFRVRLLETVSPDGIIPASMDIPVLYEDEDILVVNKPADMPVHPSIGNYTNTLANGIAAYLEAKGEICPFRCINRLDRDTSGALILAKNALSAAVLSVQMRNRQIRRTYLAVVQGITHKSGTITAPISRVTDSVIERHVDFQNGESAVTHYQRLETKNNLSLLEIHLETGRTHQIRVHMKHIGHVLFNDERYGGHEILKGTHFSKYKQFVNNCFDTCPRQALHAMTLGFVHPATGEEMYFTSEMPEDMTLLIDKWRGYISNRDLE